MINQINHPSFWFFTDWLWRLLCWAVRDRRSSIRWRSASYFSKQKGRVATMCRRKGGGAFLDVVSHVSEEETANDLRDTSYCRQIKKQKLDEMQMTAIRLQRRRRNSYFIIFFRSSTSIAKRMRIVSKLKKKGYFSLFLFLCWHQRREDKKRRKRRASERWIDVSEHPAKEQTTQCTHRSEDAQS